MANKTLFKSKRGRWLQAANTTNEAGGTAYSLAPKHELAQYVVTGCLNGTFYADAEAQLSRVVQLAQKVDANFLAKLAVYARAAGYMKDMPALLLAVLTKKDIALFKAAAPLVIDNAKMLRNFVQIMRSGAIGRKSLGSAPKGFVKDWLAMHSDESIFRANVGNSPSLADIIKMVHPTPDSQQREALYAYLIGKPHDTKILPPLVQQFEAFKAAMLNRASVLSKSNKPAFEAPAMPDVPFQMLTALPLTDRQWKQIADNAGWTMTRMNLNTFMRHGVFENRKVTQRIAKRLANPQEVRKAKVFPYQLLNAYLNVSPDAPHEVREALQDAMEVATENVPSFDCSVVVCPDSSGSMQSPVTGVRQGATTSVNCVQVAALIASVILRQNRKALLLPFHDRVIDTKLNPSDSVMTNAKILSNLGYGGTNCALPLQRLNQHRYSADLVIYVSDNESWIDTKRKNTWGYNATETLQEWEKFKRYNPKARLVCIDLQPYGTTQAPERDDILNIGGFSDQVFKIIEAFAKGQLDNGHWIQRIEQSVQLVK
ncbi:vWA domain-containing protein [Cerasicoccus maritimus]|uniref:vWA domain-containing protein n=1 Tax=Cerasicoccus maritimus TaxID=490089 RepID=UPI00285275B8|nr:TROVE domain-containing protein [Cerasicoccus maritimus]